MNKPRHYKTKDTKVSEIKVGDVVLTHGRLFRITKTKQYKNHRPGMEHLPIFVHQTEDLGNAWESNPTRIPKGWLADWTIQSNDLKKWAVLQEEI